MFRCFYDDCDRETETPAGVKVVLDIAIVVLSIAIMATMVVS